MKRLLLLSIATKSNLFIMGKTPFSLKLESDLMDAVREQAKKEHRPINNFIEVVLIKYLEEIKEKENPAD